MIMLPRILLFAIAALAATYVAKQKGFNPLLWLFAVPVIGFVIVLFLPAASQDGIAGEERAKRAQLGNAIGGFLTGIVAVFTLLFFFLVFNPGEL